MSRDPEQIGWWLVDWTRQRPSLAPTYVRDYWKAGRPDCANYTTPSVHPPGAKLPGRRRPFRFGNRPWNPLLIDPLERDQQPSPPPGFREKACEFAILF